MRSIVVDTISATADELNPDKLLHCFELLGYDFMIDCEGKVFLIEVNTNPCLETESSLLSRIIPAVLDNTFKIVLDPLFCKTKRNGEM